MKKRKNNKKILILSLLLILFLTITATSAVEIQDNTTTTSDSNAIASIEDVNTVDTISVSENNNVISAGEKTFTDLQDLISGATGDRIEITDDYKYFDGDEDQGIIISKDNITINGNGHYIDGDNQAKIFKITGHNVILKNIIIKNSYFEKDYSIKNFDVLNEEQAAIVWNGENGTLDHVTIQDSIASINVINDEEYYTGTISIKGAAGIYWTGNNGIITDSTFTRNAQESLGSNDNVNFGGVLKIDGVNCTIKNSHFTSNVALTGGALRINANNVTIDNCDFTDNNATAYDGGAIRTDGYYTYIKDSIFNNNNALQTSGGAIYAGNYVNITKSKFNKNTAKRVGGAAYIAGVNGTITECVFDYNNGGSDGGALYINNYGKVIKSNFTNNYFITVNGANGGAAAVRYGIVSECNFINNWADAISSTTLRGGALYAVSTKVSKCKFINNIINMTGDGTGGALGLGGEKCSLEDSIFINNTCKGNYAGAVMSMGINCIINNCNFINNTANAYGAAIVFTLKGLVYNCNFTNCNPIRPSPSQGTISFVNSGNNMLISGCIFNNNAYAITSTQAQRNATIIGNIFINNTYAVTLYHNDTFKYNTLFNYSNSHNRIYTDSSVTVQSNWYGTNNPAVVKGSYLVAELVKIDNNNYLVGGENNPIIGIVFRDSVTNEIVTELPGRPVEYNITNPTVPFTWKDSSESGKVLANSAVKTAFNISAKIDSQDLGELTFNGANYTLGNSATFTDLQRLINSSNVGDTITLNNDYARNVFGDLSTIVINKTLTIKGNVIISGANSATIFTITADNVKIEDLTLKDGKSNGNGAAIIWTGNNGKVTNVQFTNNNADGNGGAIYSTGNNTQITKSTFTSNIAQDGSAIYIDADGAILTDSVFNKNTARLSTGSDVYIKGAKTSLDNVTVTDSQHNAITLRGHNNTAKKLNITNIKGDGLTTDGENTTITDVVMNNITNKGITTNGKNTTIDNIIANNITDTVIDTTGDNTNIGNVKTNNTGKVIDSEGNNATIKDIVADNVNGDVVSFNGDGATVSNIEGNNVAGTVVNGKGDNYEIKGVKGTNVTDGFTKLDGSGKATGIEAADPKDALKIPSNPTGNTASYKPEGLPSNANGWFYVYVDGVLYNNTGSRLRNGVANPINVTFTPGTHTVKLTVEFSGTTYNSPLENENKNVTIPAKPPVIVLTANNIIASYSANAVYTVTITADNVKIADNETVVITFNGFKQTAKTFNGTAKFTLNTEIKVGKYTITAEYKNKTVSNTVDILNIINANKLKKLKKSKKVNKVKVSLLKVDGKIQAGKKLTLKLKNKKVATAKTNKKGTATFKVKKKSLKKFKKGKKVVATVVYGADTVSKKIKIA